MKPPMLTQVVEYPNEVMEQQRGELSPAAAPGIHNQCDLEKVSFFTSNYFSIDYRIFLEQRSQTDVQRSDFIANMYYLSFTPF